MNGAVSSGLFHTLVIPLCYTSPVIFIYFCSKRSARILASKKMGFIYLLTLAVIISFVLLSKCGIAAFHQSKKQTPTLN